MSAEHRSGHPGRRRARRVLVAGVTAMASWTFVASPMAGRPAEAAIPGYNGSVAFVLAGGDGYGQIVVVSASGDVRELGVSGTSPSWSPDGRSLAFASGDDVWAVGADGTNLRRLTNTPTDLETEPAWSPDGTKIAFRSSVWGTGGLDIWTMNTDGTGRVDLTDGAYPGSDSPAWSPDGRRLAFVADDGIMTMRSDGSDVRTLTTTAGQFPDWSPDGSHVLFSTPQGLKVIGADGSAEQSAPGAPTSARHGSWSPDGTFLLYASSIVGADASGIFRVRVDGSESPVVLTSVPAASSYEASSPAWQPLPTPPAFGEFTPLAPARILDTRTGVGRNGVVGPLRENVPVAVQVTGRGGVASTGVVAVVMNVTVTQPTAWSYLTVWPSGVEQPGSSNLNFVRGQTVPNHVTVAVGDGGRVHVLNRFGTAHVIFDVVGFYADDGGPGGSRYHSVDPSRLFDTRSGLGGVPAAPVGPAKTLAFDVSGKGGVPPSGVTAVVMNVTVARATEWSYLTVFPGDLTTPPLASNLNYLPGQAVPNLVTVRVPANGVVKFYNQFGTVHVMADVVGYFDQDRTTQAGRFVPLDPYRTYDSRTYDEPWGPDEVWLVGEYPGFGGLPLGEAAAVVLNVTVTQPTAWSYLTVFPSHVCSLPNVSNLNFVAGQTVPNQVVVRLGTSDGCAGPDEIETIGVYNYDGSTQVIIDVFGFYTAASTTLFH